MGDVRIRSFAAGDEGAFFGMLMGAAIAAARAKAIRRLFLETNKKLTNAIRLYESAGFVHVPREAPSEYDRSDVCMEIML